MLPEGVSLLQVTKGNMSFDIIPYEVNVDGHPDVEKGELWYNTTYWIHRDVGPEEKMVVCPLKTWGLPCPICEEYNRLKKDPRAEKELVDTLRPKQRELYNVILKAGGKITGDIQVLEMSRHCFGKQLDEELDVDESNENAGFSDLEGGKTVRVRFVEESGGGYAYIKASRVDFQSRDKDYKEDILSDVVDLDKAVRRFNYEELEAIFNGKRPVKSSTTTEEVPEKETRSREPEEEKRHQAKSDKKCVACEGTGKNSRGGVCRICDGEGVDEALKQDAPEKEDPPEEPVRRRRRVPEPEEDPPEEEGKEDPPETTEKKPDKTSTPTTTKGDNDGWGDDDWDK